MNEPKVTIPYARCNNGKNYTALQMSKERYAYHMKWKGFSCPVDGCNRNLKWTQCSVRGKFWSHKQLTTGEGGQHNGWVAHSGETWTHILAKAKVVDNLHLIEFIAKKCPDCNQLESYRFAEPTHKAKAEHSIMKGIRADVAVLKDDELVAVISIVHTHEREPEKWKKIYDKLGVMLFEVQAQTIVSNDFLKEEENSLWSNIYAHWGRCTECTRKEAERRVLREKEPEYVLEDGRHITELSTSELTLFWRKYHGKKTEENEKKIRKVESVLQASEKCFHCGTSSAENICTSCTAFLTSTNCKMCGELTMTKWRVHCLKCCKIINSTKCQRCNKPTHSNWKKHCGLCYYLMKEEEQERREEERRRKEEEQRRKEEEWRKYVEECIRKREERRRKKEEQRREEERRREEEQRKRDIAWKKKDREDRRLVQQRRMIEEEKKRRYWEEYRRKQKLQLEKMQEENRKRKVQIMKEEELQEKLKEQAKKRQKEKAKKKRKEEKELKVYKQTNQDYQKMINDNRSDFGLPKKKVQKTMANFFKK